MPSKRVFRGLFTLVQVLGVGLVSVLFLYSCLQPSNNSHAKAEEREQWIATSHSWLDRMLCRWTTACGVAHWLWQTRLFRTPPDGAWPADFKGFMAPDADWYINSSEQFATPDEDAVMLELFKRDIPRYVIEFAPLVYLHPEEPYWPSNPAQHLQQVVPMFKGSEIQNLSLSLANLSNLNDFSGGEQVCLTSKDDIQDLPPWIQSNYSIPTPFADGIEDTIRDGSKQDPPLANGVAEAEGWYSAQPLKGMPSQPPPDYEPTDWTEFLSMDFASQSGYSKAPAVLVFIRKSNDVCDAFWFFFNSFNRGNTLLNIRFGNHVGDWEHTMIRFHRGVPKAVFTSRHSFGSSAYSYEAVEKVGKRPVVYAAQGSHAMYVTAGIQPYKVPFNLLYDTTGRGRLWDPALRNLKAYTYDLASDTLLASGLSAWAPTSWFHFKGRWGDRVYDLGDARQYALVGEFHYSTGPNGPKFKNLARRTVCENEKHGCDVKNSIR